MSKKDRGRERPLFHSWGSFRQKWIMKVLDKLKKMLSIVFLSKLYQLCETLSTSSLLSQFFLCLCKKKRNNAVLRCYSRDCMSKDSLMCQDVGTYCLNKFHNLQLFLKKSWIKKEEFHDKVFWVFEVVVEFWWNAIM